MEEGEVREGVRAVSALSRSEPAMGETLWGAGGRGEELEGGRRWKGEERGKEPALLGRKGRELVPPPPTNRRPPLPVYTFPPFRYCCIVSSPPPVYVIVYTVCGNLHVKHSQT